MNDYEDYFASLESLINIISDAELHYLDNERSLKENIELAEKHQANRVANLQAQARSAAHDYASVTSSLRTIEALKIEPATRVRPIASNLTTDEALGRQRSRAASLQQELAQFRRSIIVSPEEAADTGHESPLRTERARTGWLFSLLRALREFFVSPTKNTKHDHNRLTTEVLDRASTRGMMTGYEPRALEDVMIPETSLFHGKPGIGLGDSGFAKDAVRLGQIGEVNFAKSLVKAKLIDRFASFWSLHMISEDTYAKEDYDVDCALISRDTVWLVDVKFYTGGNVVYKQPNENEIICWDVATGAQIGKPRKMSRNMKMALERFTSRYGNYRSLQVKARVVFVPTAAGMGTIDGVRWPGNIPAVTLPDFLAELARESAYQNTLESELVRKTFSSLIKS